MRYLYDLYEGENCILSGVGAKAICERTGLPQNSNLANYYNTGGLIKGRYSLYVAGNMPSKGRDKERRKAVSDRKNEQKKFTPAMYAEWKALNRIGREYRKNGGNR